MRGKLTTILIILMFLSGLTLFLYPTVSNYINSLHQTTAIQTYSDEISQLQKEENERMWKEAEAWNRCLAGEDRWQDVKRGYDDLLNASGSGIMAYIEIPAVGITLPIGHGVEAGVLDHSVGHLDWSSLPVGGETTHCVLSGHRGLPSAELLTNIDHLDIKDVFLIHVLGETLKYRVDQIIVVEPEDVSGLQIEKGKDYVTLVTCTPYGINSHRLLVRGTRIDEGNPGTVEVTNEAKLMHPMIPVSVCMLVLVVGVFAAWICFRKKGGRT